MGYRSKHTNCIVRVIPLRGLSAQQEALCLFLREEAGRCWTEMLNAHIESRGGKWLSSSDLKKMFNGYGAQIVALHADEETMPEAELVEDMRAVVTSFAGRLYGLRSGKAKEVVECVKKATQSA